MRNIFLLILCCFAGTSFCADEMNDDNTFDKAKKQFTQGLPKDALETLRPFLLDAKNVHNKDIAEGVILAANGMYRLKQVADIEHFLEEVLKVHQEDWYAVYGVIRAWKTLQHQSFYGSIIDNKFQRGTHNGQRVYAMEHDRIRILQLYRQAVLLAATDKDNSAVAHLYLNYAREWQTAGWKMQVLTDIATLPDYSADNSRYYGGGHSAPVDEDGNPILYRLPESFEKAKNDGERWRWCLAKAAELDKNLLNNTLQQRADFSLSQFGEQTLLNYSFFRSRKPKDTDTQAAIWNLESLKDNEVIARVAIGIKRFELPDEFHYIALFKQCGAWSNLANVAENRMQYEKAVGYYEKLLAENPKNEYAKNCLLQITGNWGRFDTAGSDVKGANPFLRYVFRNGKKVHLTVNEIKIPELLNDIKEYLKSKPQQLDWQKIQIEQIGYNLIFARKTANNKQSAEEVRRKYLGKKVAAWDVPLQSAERYYDDAVQIPLNLGKSGAFLVKAVMENGNTQYAVVWLTDTAIVQKQLDKAVLYYVADSQTGQPLENVSMDFFGYKIEQRLEQRADNRNRQLPPEWFFNEFGKNTDKDGFVILNQDEAVSDFNFLITAKDGDNKRFAYLGFNTIWFNEQYDEQYNEVKAFFISDRPVYRPGDTVKYKFWVGTAKYDQHEQSSWAGKSVKYEIYNPKGEKTTEQTVKLDGSGGYAGELVLPKDCPLGIFHVPFTEIRGYGNFRIEEYKKPEYEVSIDAPKEPLKLGDKFTAVIKAKYYFGSPVSEATVKYKVLREKADETWYPILPWDWFYGSGYGWFAYNTPWLDGFYRWGHCRPAPLWNPYYAGPPEVIAEVETKIKPDGTVEVPLDTSLAKALYPDDSHRYTITAEVMDNSRRTITGTGSVLAAKEPFKIYTWTDKGYYVEAQKIAASFQARRLDGKAVSGDAEVKVFRLIYDASIGVNEQLVHSASVKLNEDGAASIPLNAATAGQYRISCTLNGQEGGYVFNVYQGGLKAAANKDDFRYNALELIPDKTEYKTGEQVQLRINTNRENAAVLLFLKPSNGVVSNSSDNKPQLIRFNGKSQLVSVPVELKDMPNFFVEALTLSDGVIVNEIKEIAVPPAQKVLNVNIKPSSEMYKPGEKAKAEIIITDLDGKPVAGQIVVSIYDKPIEYISGGSNVPDIKEFFWKWKRYHYPQSQSNLDKYTQVFDKPDKPDMQQLNIFGGMTELSRGRGTATMGGGDIAMDNSVSDAAMPMAAAPPMKEKESLLNSAKNEAAVGKRKQNADKNVSGGSETGLVEPVIRKNFADTAFWTGALETDKNGKADIELTMPESLTTWKISVWNMSSGTRVGFGSTEIITRKNLIIRMQTPRFLVEKDKCIFTANVHNYLANEKNVDIFLSVDDKIQLTGDAKRSVKIPSQGEAKIDWEVEAETVGDAVITMKALTDEESDAMQKTLPVYVHGILKQEAWSGYIPANSSPAEEQGRSSQSVEITVPAERKSEQTKLTVRFSPTLAASMIDTLPYLVDYPYGCTEQTLNRFLPTAIVKKILTDMNIDLAKIKDIKTNLNTQELGDKTVRKSRRLAKVNPVFDTEQVTEMVRDGITKLTDGQNPDGGWGWFGGEGSHSSAHLTALTVHGLRLAKANDAAVDNIVIDRGVAWLERYQKEQIELLKTGELPEEQRKNKRYKTKADDTDAFVFMVISEGFLIHRNGGLNEDMKNYLWQNRGNLSLYAVAMFGIALTNNSHSAEGVSGGTESIQAAAESSKERNMPGELVRIIEQYLIIDNENQTAYLDLQRYNNWCWWSWYGSEFETQAYYLKLLMRTNPKSEVAPKLVKYLLNNRRNATYWNSTRDTAIVIETFAEFLKATKEDKPDMTVEVLFDGQVKKNVKITPDNLFAIDNTLILSAEEVQTGKHKIELRKTDNSPSPQGRGVSPLYYSVYMQNFSLENPLKKAGLEVKIERRFYKLERDETAKSQVTGNRGQVIDIKMEKQKRISITSPSVLNSGDLIEVELLIESKNDYESILIEDRKAAGLEPVEVRSGYQRCGSLYPYVEFRDEQVAFFVERLPRGQHSLTYRLRAEQPGQFSALPAKVEAMYAPELKGNSDEDKVKVEDKQ